MGIRPVITNLYDSTSLMLLYSKIWNDVATRFRREWRQCRFQEVGWTALSAAGLGGLHKLGIDPVYIGGAFGTSILGVGGLVWYHGHYLSGLRSEMTSLEYLGTSFQRTHAREVQDGDEFVASLWQRVRHALQTSLKAGFDSTPNGLDTVSANELQQLHDLLDKEIPRLRRLASDGVP